MGRQDVALVNFNRGVLSPLALARTDVDKIQFMAEEQTNFIPRVLGSMMMRPGTEYIGSTRNNLASVYIPFIFSASDTALLELTDSTLRVWISDDLLTRPTVTTAVTNGTFASNITSWTNASESGATAAYTASDGGCAALTGTGFNYAILTQTVTTVETNVEHALRVQIARGPVTMLVGSTAGADDYVEKTELDEGWHSLAFTPTGNFYIRFESRLAYEVRVAQCVVESAGVVTITAPYAAADLPLVRFTQSADVVYLACSGHKQYKIERRTTTSWSVTKYLANDGPFRTENLGPTTISSNAVNGDMTLTASKPLFKSTHVGALFLIDSVGQYVEQSVTGENQWTNEIRITGVGAIRNFNVTRTGTWSGTVTLQRSSNGPGSWVDVTSYTTNAVTSYNDALDNQITYYRLGIKTGGYTSGTAVVSLTYDGGSITGIVRITGYSSSTSVTAHALKSLGGGSASSVWAEGAWSDFRGYPSAVALFEGRLWWAGKAKIWGSVADGYESFDPDFEGDAGPISRTIAVGPVDTVNWLVPAQRLLLGTASGILSAKSSSLDEPLTPSAFSLKTVTTNGSHTISATLIDAAAVYAHRSTSRVYLIDSTSDVFDKYNYSTVDLTSLCPEFCQPGITRMAVQSQPDSRIHCVRSDGTVAVLLLDRTEDVKGWVSVETDGDVEDVVILPGTVEDSVYYLVNRTINGSTVRYLEKWALESECIGGSLNKNMDSHVSYTGVAISSLAVSHLEGEVLDVWADGDSIGPKTVTSGSISLGGSYTNVVAGLPYTSTYKSAKLAYASQSGSALTKKKKISYLGLILANVHKDALEFGPDFTTMDPMPRYEEETTASSVVSHYDQDPILFPGQWDTDSRLCLRVTSPYPCTVLSGVVAIETNG
jgi:hypothetical protein